VAEIRPDSTASDLRAAWMPGSHSEWAFRIGSSRIPKSPSTKWKVYVVVRVEKAADANRFVAFGAGVYDDAAKNYPADAKLKVVISRTDTGLTAWARLSLARSATFSSRPRATPA